MNVFIVGISGKMGRALCECAKEKNIAVSGGIDKIPAGNVPVFSCAREVNVPVDAVIDFSRPQTLGEIIELCTARKCPCVLATTGYSAQDEAEIKKFSQSVAVFKSENMSLGINALSCLAQKAAKLLKDFNIEIIEKHHNQKADAPSGTAKLLARAVENGIDYSPEYRYGREGAAKRNKNEIGVHAVRGGTIVGEHEILFCGNNEVIALSHSAGSRTVFAEGALTAAKWLQGKTPGLYDMHDMLGI